MSHPLAADLPADPSGAATAGRAPQRPLGRPSRGITPPPGGTEDRGPVLPEIPEIGPVAPSAAPAQPTAGYTGAGATKGLVLISGGVITHHDPTVLVVDLDATPLDPDHLYEALKELRQVAATDARTTAATSLQAALSRALGL